MRQRYEVPQKHFEKDKFSSDKSIKDNAENNETLPFSFSFFLKITKNPFENGFFHKNQN